MFIFNKRSLFLSCSLFFLLAYIALYVDDQFVRPFLGDVIVVGWLYAFLKSFLRLQGYNLAHFVLIFSYLVEIAQYFNLISILGLSHINAVRIVFGATFDWLDLLAYTIGWLSILLIERKLRRCKENQDLVKHT